MKLLVGAATVPKKGNSSEENEDAYGPPISDGLKPVPFNCAVADGATETSYSALWAKMLVDCFCLVEDPKQFDAQLTALREKWKHSTGGKSLPWYAEQKLEKGAFATLLGVRITDDGFPHLRWQAVNVGDSVLFHVRGCELLAMFPNFASADFQARPMLLTTNTPLPEEKSEDLYHYAEGILEAGDRLYLATDKIAEWIVRGLENDTKPFVPLDQLTRIEGSFAAFIEHLVAHNELRNDDYTLLWIEARNEA